MTPSINENVGISRDSTIGQFRPNGLKMPKPIENSKNTEGVKK